MEWLGHKNSEMTRGYYHLYDKEAQNPNGPTKFSWLVIFYYPSFSFKKGSSLNFVGANECE